MNGNTAASVSEDGTVRVWNLGNGKAIYTLPLADAGAPRSVCFSHDGRLLAATGDRAIALWDLKSGVDLKTDPAPQLFHPSPVPLMSAAFVPTHQMLVAAGVESAPPPPPPM